MELTREIYERVLKERAEVLTMEQTISKAEIHWLDKKFPPKREGWWYCPNDKFLAFIKDGKRWGWSGHGVWFSDNGRCPWGKIQPAPQELVVERVKDELKKRGYVEGVEVRCLFDKLQYTINKPISLSGIKDQLIGSGKIWIKIKGADNPLIMKNGEWAEIIDTKNERLNEIEKQLESLLKEVNQLKNK